MEKDEPRDNMKEDADGSGHDEDDDDDDDDDKNDDKESEENNKEERKARWTVLDPKRGQNKVENLLKEPVLSALTRQVEFNYTWYVLNNQVCLFLTTDVVAAPWARTSWRAGTKNSTLETQLRVARES